MKLILKGLAFFSKEEAAQYDWQTEKKFCNLEVTLEAVIITLPKNMFTKN